MRIDNYYVAIQLAKRADAMRRGIAKISRREGVDAAAGVARESSAEKKLSKRVLTRLRARERFIRVVSNVTL